MLFASREIQITEQKLHLTLFAPPKNELALFGFFRSLCRTLFSSPNSTKDDGDANKIDWEFVLRNEP